MDKKTCCCTGHRPKGFPFEYEKEIWKHMKYLFGLTKRIITIIEGYGITEFISGMALGADMDFAATVIGLREWKYPNIKLECALPCRNQTLKWEERDKKKYDKILSKADEVTLVSEEYSRECMMKRNKYMVDKSDLVLAIYNGKERGGTCNTMKYAEKKGVKTEWLYLPLFDDLL